MILKRLFDIAASIFSLIVFSPVFIVIAILIKVKMPGPIFFRQNRVGRDARLFRNGEVPYYESEPWWKQYFR